MDPGLPGSGKALQILIGQPGNQVQMQVDVLFPGESSHNLTDPVKLRAAVNALKCQRIRGLDTDLHLDQSWQRVER